MATGQRSLAASPLVRLSRLLWTVWLRRLRWVTHPITVFVFLQVVWLAITLIWVIWFVDQQAGIAKLAQRFGQEYFSSEMALGILVIGCVLLGVLLVGTILLFVFGQRQSAAVRQQRTFVSSVTHELKSPLASLQLAFETMSTRQLDAATSQHISKMIQADIDRLRRLIDQILVTGRLDRSGILFDEAPGTQTPMDSIIAQLVERLQYLDSNLGKRLTIDCPPGLMVPASPSALILILNNLLENAVKYSPIGAEIHLGVDRNEHEVLLYVRDQGLGLDKQDKRRLFKMFRRGDTAIKKAIPGTGLGLYIIKSAVRVLGGRVWAESEGRGKGATFYVSLPALDQYAQARIR